MTVSNTLDRYQYVGNGSTTQFSFPVVFIAPTDLAVMLWNTTTQQLQPSVLNGANAYDFTIVGTQDPVSGEYLSGCAVQFNTAPPSYFTITLWRNPPITQSAAFELNDPLPPAVLNTALDRAAMISQALQDQLTRTVTAPPTDPPPPGNPSLTLPIATTRANGIVGFDLAGNVIVGGNLSLLLSLLGGTWTPSLGALTWCAGIAALRALAPPAANAPILLIGGNTVGDRTAEIFVYDPTNSNADDGATIIQPTSVSGNGRWVLA